MSGLITIIGGKWTTYRKMAEDTIEKAIMLGGLPERECITRHLPIHGFKMDVDPFNDILASYGIYKEEILSMAEEEEKLGGFLSEKLQIYKAQIAWAVRKEMARTVEDVLARRTRALFLDARESIRIAPVVADIIADELGKDEGWKLKQIADFEAVANNYFFKD